LTGHSPVGYVRRKSSTVLVAVTARMAGKEALLTPTSTLAYTVGTPSTAGAPTAVAAGTPFTLTVRFLQPDGTWRSTRTMLHPS